MKYILNLRNFSSSIKNFSTPLIIYNKNRKKMVDEIFKNQEFKQKNINVKESYYNMYQALNYLKKK
tara:strand:- start:1084 stop:1281 length:198 start_codon:yes stop_codon:yes gene_type:complete